MRKILPLIIIVSPTFLLGCDGEKSTSQRTCESALPELDCTPVYSPTFDRIYRETIAQKCAVGGGACHLAAGRAGGLVLEGLDVAYDALVAAAEKESVHGSGCGDLLSRLALSEAPGAMPPGAPLTSGELCALTQWVRQGYPR